MVKAITSLWAGLLVGGLLATGQSFSAVANQTTQTNSGGGVTVNATMLDSTANGDLRFQIAFDTHSVNLDAYNLQSLTILRDGSANIYQPTSVNSKGGGHHRLAMVTFAKPENIKRMELVIKGVAGVHERVFVWDLQ